jgi:hypothetical protein
MDISYTGDGGLTVAGLGSVCLAVKPRVACIL